VVVTRGEPPEIAMVDSSGATRFRTLVWNGLWFSVIPEMASYADEFTHLTQKLLATHHIFISLTD
jgi:hypothetical protein